MRPGRQVFPAPPALDLPRALESELARLNGRIRPGARIAVGVGSRGITNLEAVVLRVIEYLRAAGAQPFIVPAMGSHGGATPEGQRQLLADYGVTEQSMGVPIEASMEATRIGATPDGVPVFFSAVALNSDGVMIINRVKPHTDFHSEHLGSGLLKMLVVGMGKRAGAANYHTLASRHGYEEILRHSSRVTLRVAPILAGVALIEDQYHATSQVAVVLPGEMEERETGLYHEARALMPRLPFDDIDLLVVDQIGKNISGSGMDPNIIGRSLHGYSALLSDRSTRPSIRRIFVRGLTPQSHGNAVGVGLADFTSSRLVRGIDSGVTYLNALTAMSLQSVKIPIHFETDREAVGWALESLALADPAGARVVRIQNTLSLERVEISASLAAEVEASAGRREGFADLEFLGPLAPMRFESDDNLPPVG